jgi:pimeloyl-ACP methyl ester carboxylesterase
MPFADINGQRICFEDTGGDGLPIVLSHGFLMDHEMFAPQVQALSPEFRVIAWDERGFGQTVFDGAPFTYWDSARDCLGLLDELGIDDAVLGGMSQGGFLSLRAALLAPARVRALVLIDTQAGTEDPVRLPAYRQMQETWLEHGPIDQVTEAIAQLIISSPPAAGRGCTSRRSRRRSHSRSDWCSPSTEINRTCWMERRPPHPSPWCAADG